MPKPTGFSYKSNARPDTSSKSTPARNTSIPKSPIAKKSVTHEAIAKRAYEIYASGRGGSQVDNWLRAESELKNS
jgi:hypothetical protein